MKINVSFGGPEWQEPDFTPRERALIAKHHRIVNLSGNTERSEYLKKAGGAKHFPELYWAPGEGEEAYRLLRAAQPPQKLTDTEWWDSLSSVVTFTLLLGVLFVVGWVLTKLF